MNNVISTLKPSLKMLTQSISLASLLAFVGLASSCQSIYTTANPLFSWVKNVIPFENLPRLKSDNGVIAALDQKGFQDLIVTKNGHHVRIFCNDNGQYSTPQNIATGDMHRMKVADYDRDGRMDLIMAQGCGACSSAV